MPTSSDHFCFSQVITYVDGVSPYNKRSGRGKRTAGRVPLGALIDFMHQPETKIENWNGIAITGLFVGRHVHPGMFGVDTMSSPSTRRQGELRFCSWKRSTEGWIYSRSRTTSTTSPSQEDGEKGCYRTKTLVVPKPQRLARRNKGQGCRAHSLSGPAAASQVADAEDAPADP